jgi:hypothetical protein
LLPFSISKLPQLGDSQLFIREKQGFIDENTVQTNTIKIHKVTNGVFTNKDGDIIY